MKIVAFSVFGDRDLYIRGIVSNARLMSEVYPNWEMWCWHDDSIPKDTLKSLEDLGVHLLNAQGIGITGKMWRMLAHDIAGCERFVCRDADSRISVREFHAVEEWERSGLDFHIMRDHPGHHDFPIMAGMWGAKGRAMGVKIETLIRAYVVPIQHYGYDQGFLKNYVWPRARTRCLIHDSSGNVGSDFPDPRVDRFVGEVIGVDEKPTPWTPYEYAP